MSRVDVKIIGRVVGDVWLAGIAFFVLRAKRCDRFPGDA